ncbi:sarcotoxin-2A-like [Lucilia sericata]|uniref:sarcotoxin-2A-like n=1 Tax=Lucilia sericata TaxID=13632 RepID=UPI0018A868CA|nr:sarcotoxin-2A-like [Lucilia sericata]
MKSIFILAACLAFMAVVSAYPQIVYPPSMQHSAQPIRVRREVITGHTVAKNPNGGHDVSVSATKVIGNEHGTAFGKAFAQGNTEGGNTLRGITIGGGSNGLSASVTKTQTDISDSFIKQAQANLKLDNSNAISAHVGQMNTKIKGPNFNSSPELKFVTFKWSNANGHGASFSRENNKGISETETKAAIANLFHNRKHNLDASFFDTNVAYNNGYNFGKTGGLLDYTHADGHGLNAGLTRYSGIGKKAEVNGYTNLFTSQDGRATLNANAGASRWFNGPYGGQNDYGFGLGFRYNDW